MCASVNMQYGELDRNLTINVSWHCWLLKILSSAQFWEACQHAFEIQWKKICLDRTLPLICSLELSMISWKCLFSHYLPCFQKFRVTQKMTGPTSKAAKLMLYQFRVLRPRQTSLSPSCVRQGNRQVRNKVVFFAQGPNNLFVLYACT